MSDYLTIQHPPFCVADSRAIDVLLFEFGMHSLDDLKAYHDHISTERQVISAYVLKLYTGLTVKQACGILGMSYGTTQVRIGDLVKKVRAYPGSNTAKTLNNIINRL